MGKRRISPWGNTVSRCVTLCHVGSGCVTLHQAVSRYVNTTHLNPQPGWSLFLFPGLFSRFSFFFFQFCVPDVEDCNVPLTGSVWISILLYASRCIMGTLWRRIIQRLDGSWMGKYGSEDGDRPRGGTRWSYDDTDERQRRRWWRCVWWWWWWWLWLRWRWRQCRWLMIVAHMPCTRSAPTFSHRLLHFGLASSSVSVTVHVTLHTTPLLPRPSAHTFCSSRCLCSDRQTEPRVHFGFSQRNRHRNQLPLYRINPTPFPQSSICYRMEIEPSPRHLCLVLSRKILRSLVCSFLRLLGYLVPRLQYASGDRGGPGVDRGLVVKVGRFGREALGIVRRSAVNAGRIRFLLGSGYSWARFLGCTRFSGLRVTRKLKMCWCVHRAAPLSFHSRDQFQISPAASGTINRASYSMKNLAFHSLLGRKMIILPIRTNSRFSKVGRTYFFNSRVKALNLYQILHRVLVHKLTPWSCLNPVHDVERHRIQCLLGSIQFTSDTELIHTRYRIRVCDSTRPSSEALQVRTMKPFLSEVRQWTTSNWGDGTERAILKSLFWVELHSPVLIRHTTGRTNQI